MKPTNYDEYIDQAQEFAQPMLKFFRECLQETCPEIKEEFKWGFPNFTYNGSILCHMAGFKQHVTFGFWLGLEMSDHAGIMKLTKNSGMGNFGKLTSMEDLPDRETLVSYIQEAIRLTDAGIKPSSTSSKNKQAEALEIPQLLADALSKNKVALSTFDNFSQSKRNEYSEWIADAKTEKTKLKRLDQTIEWLEEGKSRNWKYMRK